MRSAKPSAEQRLTRLVFIHWTDEIRLAIAHIVN
jgi:hypothetical protein